MYFLVLYVAVPFFIWLLLLLLLLLTMIKVEEEFEATVVLGNIIDTFLCLDPVYCCKIGRIWTHLILLFIIIIALIWTMYCRNCILVKVFEGEEEQIAVRTAVVFGNINTLFRLEHNVGCFAAIVSASILAVVAVFFFIWLSLLLLVLL